MKIELNRFILGIHFHDKILFYLLLINFCSICNAEFNDVEIPPTYSQVEWTAARFIHIVYMAFNGHTTFFSCEKK